MKKSEMIRELLSSRSWNGTRDSKFLQSHYSKAEIKDLYGQLPQANEEYNQRVSEADDIWECYKCGSITLDGWCDNCGYV